MLYMVTFTINIPPMLAYIAYMDPMGYGFSSWPRNYGTKLTYSLVNVGSVQETVYK